MEQESKGKEVISWDVSRFTLDLNSFAAAVTPRTEFWFWFSDLAVVSASIGVSGLEIEGVTFPPPPPPPFLLLDCQI